MITALRDREVRVPPELCCTQHRSLPRILAMRLQPYPLGLIDIRSARRTAASIVAILPRLRSRFLENTLHSPASDSCTQQLANGDET
jgi:hypothetical protein